jgi:hypothetical protein
VKAQRYANPFFPGVSSKARELEEDSVGVVSFGRGVIAQRKSGGLEADPRSKLHAVPPEGSDPQALNEESRLREGVASRCVTV